MNMQLVSSATRLRDRLSLRGVPIRLVALGVAVVFTAGQMQAQGPMFRSVDEAQPAAAAQQAVPAAQAALSAQVGTEISAPVPNGEEANAASSSTIPFAALEASDNGSQSSTLTSTSTVAPAKTKPPHRGLGIAMATVGILAAGVGVLGLAAYSKFCGTSNGPCGEARGIGIAGLAGGGALAAGGFYLQFHRPAQ